MKAERRHQLKQNALAQWLEELPEMARRNRTMIVMVAVLIVLGIVVFYSRMNDAQQKTALAEQSLIGAEESITDLGGTIHYDQGREAGVVQFRDTTYRNGIQAADDAVEQDGGDSKIKARALIDKGDLNFTLANLPAVTGATTQPSLRQQQSQTELLDGAQSAYEAVLNQFPNEAFYDTSAHFGLAATAEDRAMFSNDPAQWTAAQKQYQAVIDSSAGPSFKELAKERLALLPKLQQTPIVGLFPELPPTTRAVMGPTFDMTSRPSAPATESSPILAPIPMPTTLPTTR